MKKTFLFITIFFTNLCCFAQDTEAPSIPTNLRVEELVGALLWDSSTDNVEVMEYDVYVNDVFNQTVPHYAGINNGVGLTAIGVTTSNTYTFKVLARDTSGNESTFTNTLSYTRTDPIDDQEPDQLYLSKIMNVDNNNKAIEITNLTNVDINLSTYSLKISNDGSPTWTATYNFPSNTVLSDNDVIVIANSGATLCASQYDIINDVITNFDGNDVIGLFYNDTLIDSLGDLGVLDTYINNNTIAVRPVFNDFNTFWDTFSLNSTDQCFGFLGEVYYVYLLSTPEVSTYDMAIYPNPTNGDILYVNTKNNVEITSLQVYDMTGKQVLQQTNPSNEINIQELQKGIYILQLNTYNQTINKKLIIQ